MMATPPSVDVKHVKWSVGHNVDINTSGIPPQIAALPEDEQGPALVEAILRRKRGD
jgi:hypothetical protein